MGVMHIFLYISLCWRLRSKVCTRVILMKRMLTSWWRWSTLDIRWLLVNVLNSVFWTNLDLFISHTILISVVREWSNFSRGSTFTRDFLKLWMVVPTVLMWTSLSPLHRLATDPHMEFLILRNMSATSCTCSSNNKNPTEIHTILTKSMQSYQNKATILTKYRNLKKGVHKKLRVVRCVQNLRDIRIQHSSLLNREFDL